MEKHDDYLHLISEDGSGNFVALYLPEEKLRESLRADLTILFNEEKLHYLERERDLVQKLADQAGRMTAFLQQILKNSDAVVQVLEKVIPILRKD